MRLKYTQIKEYREQQLVKQNHCCFLCGDKITDDAVLDHNHSTGNIRRVLHRGCNALLGKIENNMKRNKVSLERLDVWAKNLVAYMTEEHTQIQHPTHKVKKKK